MSTDEEIEDDYEFFFNIQYRDSNRQCYWCGGWYWFCSCNLEKDETKRDFQRWLELEELDRKNYENSITKR